MKQDTEFSIYKQPYSDDTNTNIDQDDQDAIEIYNQIRNGTVSHERKGK